MRTLASRVKIGCRLIVQSSRAPANIRNAIVDLIAENTVDLRVAAAYVTSDGSKILLDAVRNTVGAPAFARMSKTLVTSFDFGLTDPRALQDWLALRNATVRISGARRLSQGLLRPVRAFHPKIYAFGREDRTYGVLVGSANLTGRGFSGNTEAAWVQRNVSHQEIDSAFTQMHRETRLLSPELLATYKAMRQAQPPPPEIKQEVQRVARPAPVAPGQILPLREAIERGEVNPVECRAMWVQVEGLQGGSHSQLELPRGGHRFFGFEFNRYDHHNIQTIGRPPLRSGARQWNDRLLTWHGNNQMERLNLPTSAQGGFAYADSAIMFRRLRDGSFELVVTPWDSDLARSWRQASAQCQLLFRVGSSSNRLVGLL